MKILYLDHTAELGGGEIALCNQVTALDKRRFQPVFVLASHGPLVERLQTAGLETHVLPLSKQIVGVRKDDLGSARSLKLKTLCGVLGYAVTLARWAKKHDIDLIHCNSLKSDIYGGIASRLAGIPAVWHVHDSISEDYLPKKVVRMFRWLSTWLPTSVVANSQSTKRTLLGLSPTQETAQRERTNNVDVVYCGYPSSIVTEDSHLESETAPHIALVGRLAPWKGQHIFLRAAAAVATTYPNAIFQVIGAPLFGECDYERKLHALANELNIAHQVEFTGFLSDVPSVLRKTTVAVHASTIGEPFGQVVIEAMALGKPVIATGAGALPEIVESGKSGILVPCNDVDAMANALIWMLSHPEQRKEMGITGQRRVRDHFTIGHSVARLAEVYDRLETRVGIRSAGRPEMQTRPV